MSRSGEIAAKSGSASYLRSLWVVNHKETAPAGPRRRGKGRTHVDKKWWTLIAVCAGMFMLLLDVTIVIVAQPAIQAGLHAQFSDVQWTLDAYALTLASLLLTSGALADRFGRKRLFAIGLAIFTLGSLLCGLAAEGRESTR